MPLYSVLRNNPGEAEGSPLGSPHTGRLGRGRVLELVSLAPG